MESSARAAATPVVVNRTTASSRCMSSLLCRLPGGSRGSRPRDGRQRAPSRAATPPRGAGRASGTCDRVEANRHGTLDSRKCGAVERRSGWRGDVPRFLPALEGGGGWLDALTELLHRRFLLLVAAQMA